MSADVQRDAIVLEPSTIVVRCAAAQRIPPCISIRGPAPVTSSVYAVGGGAFSCSWVAVNPGLYSVSVLFDDQHVEGSPFAVMVHDSRAAAAADYMPAGAGAVVGGWVCSGGAAETGAQLRQRSPPSAAAQSQAASCSCGPTTHPLAPAPGCAGSMGVGRTPERPSTAKVPLSVTRLGWPAPAQGFVTPGPLRKGCAPVSAIETVGAVAVVPVASAGQHGSSSHGNVHNQLRAVGSANRLSGSGKARSPRDEASEASGGAWRGGRVGGPTRHTAGVKPSNRRTRMEAERHGAPPRAANGAPPGAASSHSDVPHRPASVNDGGLRLLGASFLLGPSTVAPGGTVELLLSYPGFGQRSRTGCVVVAGVTGPARATTTVSERQDGLYSIAVADMSVSGGYNVHASVNGLAAVGSPHRLRVGPLGASADRCYAGRHGEATAGNEAEVLIVACDRTGERLTRGGSRFEAWLHPTASGGGRGSSAGLGTAPEAIQTPEPIIPVQMHDCGDGTHAARFTATAAGVHALYVQLGGAPISGSPFSVVVAPGRTSAANSLVVLADETGGWSPGVRFGPVENLALGGGAPAAVAAPLEHCGRVVAAGSQCRVTVTPRDSLDNRGQAALAEPWRVELERMPLTEVSVATGAEAPDGPLNSARDHRSGGSGGCGAGCSVEAPGAACPECVASSARPGEAIAGWRFQRAEQTPGAPGASPCLPMGKQGSGPLSSSQATWPAIERPPSSPRADAWLAQDPLSASRDPVLPESLPISAHCHGRLIACFSPSIAGVYRLSVLLAGSHAGGSPFCFRVRHGAVDPNRCDLLAPVPAAVPIWTSLQLTVVLRDRFGNPCIGAKASEHPCTARARAPLHVATRAAAPLRVVALPGGRHRVTCALGTRGSHALRIFVDGVCLAATCDACVQVA